MSTGSFAIMASVPISWSDGLRQSYFSTFPSRIMSSLLPLSSLSRSPATECSLLKYSAILINCFYLSLPSQLISERWGAFRQVFSDERGAITGLSEYAAVFDEI